MGMNQTESDGKMMKGVIEKVLHQGQNNSKSAVFICGDDGNTYFGLPCDFLHKGKHYVTGKTVTFDIVKDDVHTHDRAVNIDVEIPVNAEKPAPELVSIQHLQDGAFVKRTRWWDGELHSYIIKDGRLIIHALSQYEKDIIWIYRRGPSGYDGERQEME